MRTNLKCLNSPHLTEPSPAVWEVGPTSGVAPWVGQVFEAFDLPFQPAEFRRAAPLRPAAR